MERERRKRKLENSNDEEENEDEKMEKFFALIKSTKDVKDLLLNKEKTEKKKVEGSEDDEKKRKSIWTPTFQPEDFIDSEDQLGRSSANVSFSKFPPDAAARSENEKQDLKEAIPAVVAAAPENYEKKEEPRDQLDLNLYL